MLKISFGDKSFTSEEVKIERVIFSKELNENQEYIKVVYISIKNPNFIICEINDKNILKIEDTNNSFDITNINSSLINFDISIENENIIYNYTFKECIE